MDLGCQKKLGDLSMESTSKEGGTLGSKIISSECRLYVGGSKRLDCQLVWISKDSLVFFENTQRDIIMSLGCDEVHI